MEDNLKEEFKGEIDSVLGHSMLYPLSFDALRAVVFELDLDSTFNETMEDLNITATASGDEFVLMLFNGKEPVYGSTSVSINFIENKFHSFISRVVGRDQTGTIYMDSKEKYFITCDLERMRMKTVKTIVMMKMMRIN